PPSPFPLRRCCSTSPRHCRRPCPHRRRCCPTARSASWARIFRPGPPCPIRGTAPSRHRARRTLRRPPSPPHRPRLRRTPPLPPPVPSGAAGAVPVVPLLAPPDALSAEPRIPVLAAAPVALPTPVPEFGRVRKRKRRRDDALVAGLNSFCLGLIGLGLIWMGL